MLESFYRDFDKWMQGTKLPPADTGAVGRVLELLGGVKEWAPPSKRGKRTYSDEKFVASVARQLEKGERDVSQRQLETLVKMAWRYRDQLPDAESTLKELGFGELLAAPELQPPRETTERKLALLADVELNENTREFVNSLAERVKGGRRLTPAQVGALNNILVANGSSIENFESMRESLELGDAEEEDRESGPLLEALKPVTEWKPPVQRGKRTFDDKAFYESLSKHFEQRGSLSPRQRAALKRMVRRYRDQIPDYRQLAETWGIGETKK